MELKSAVKILNGREYMHEISKEEEELFRLDNIAVVFGASDDLMEFRGAIYDELGSGSAFILDGELLQNKCDEGDDCPYFIKMVEEKKPKEIKAVWVVWVEDGNVSWRYETKIPHEKFIIYDDGDQYCEGIVFRIDKMGDI